MERASDAVGGQRVEACGRVSPTANQPSPTAASSRADPASAANGGAAADRWRSGSLGAWSG